MPLFPRFIPSGAVQSIHPAACILARHPHIAVNRSAKRCKARTPDGGRLRSGLGRQHAARDAAGGDAVAEVVPGAIALDDALCAGEDGADEAEVLG